MLGNVTFTPTGGTWDFSAVSLSVGSWIFSDQNGSPTTVGELMYDNTIAGLDDGGFVWYDDDQIKYLVASSAAPSVDASLLIYDSNGGHHNYYVMSGGATMTDAGVITITPPTQSGTHASPSTTNPLAPTWTTTYHTVWYGATGEIDLPAASGYTGRAILVYNTGAFTITIDPNGSEVIVRTGTVQTGGVSMTLSSGAGNYVALLCDGVRWATIGYIGTLAAGS